MSKGPVDHLALRASVRRSRGTLGALAEVGELRTVEAHLRALFEHALDAILLFDDERRVVDANPALCELSGHGLAELVVMRITDVVVGDDRETVERDWARLMDEGRLRGTAAIAHRDGHTIEIEYQAVAGIEPGIHLLIARDVTERRRAEADLRFQAQLLEAVGEAVVATDLDGRITYWNQAAERFYGWAEDEVLGRHLDELILPPGDRGRLGPVLGRVRRGETWTSELVEQRRDGTTRTGLVTIAPYRGLDGEPIGSISTSTDISARKQAEAQLRRRIEQQHAVARLGQYALVSRNPDDVVAEARRLVTEALAIDDVEVEVVPSASEQDADAIDGVCVPAGDGAALCVRPHGGRPLDERDHEFLHSVAHVVRTVVDRDLMNRRLEHLATHDGVTGLPNRTLFLDRVTRRGGEARRSQDRFAVLSVDLDNFELVTDALGQHDVDRLLRLVAGHLQQAVSPGDTIARSGPSGFALLCRDLEGDGDAVAVTNRIYRTLRAVTLDDHPDLVLSASIGVALDDGRCDASTLLRRAVTAMHAARRRGNNRVEVFDERLRTSAQQRLDIAATLRTTLDDGRVVVHYQPCVELATGRIVGVEALARLPLPDGGLLSPSQFIPVAEATGLVGLLGEQVLEQACTAATGWLEGDPAFMVSVNVAAQQLADPDIVTIVAGIASRARLDPHCLWLELTESALLSDPDVHATMRQLRDQGIRLAIDDFGTGYSSLAYLRQLPADMLKIDRSFVNGLTDDVRDRALVAATIDLARSFGLSTTAEGVETEGQRAALTALGCDYAQGYLWSPPVPADDLTAMLERASSEDG